MNHVICMRWLANLKITLVGFFFSNFNFLKSPSSSLLLSVIELIYRKMLCNLMGGRSHFLVTLGAHMNIFINVEAILPT